MTGSYSEILERPLLKQGIAEEEDEEREKAEDGKEEVSLFWATLKIVTT